MTLIELEVLDKLIKACKKVLEYNSPTEQNHFEECCSLTEELGEETYEEILELAGEHGQKDHIYLQLLQMEEALPRIELYLKTSLPLHPLKKYSNYFSNLENVG